MMWTRREFLIGSGVSLASATLGRGEEGPRNVAGVNELRDGLTAVGFDPTHPRSALLAVIGDVHLNLDRNDSKFTDSFDDRLVDELNQLSPAISELVIAGDLIVHHSVSIGGNRYPSHYALARSEFQLASQQINRFRPGIRVRAVPGNHDTDRFENDAELWREELRLPPIKKPLLEGCRCF